MIRELSCFRDIDRLQIEPVTTICRRLSAPEYYHASVGRYARTVYPAREIVFVVEGVSDGRVISWRSAIDQVAAVNPGLRLRMDGQCLRAHWRSDGTGPCLRIVDSCDWDGYSECGSEFIDSTVLSLEDGPTAEVIVAGHGDRTRIIFRVLHAVMDGMGVMHFLQEMFRSLRGETMLGSNASFSDTDLMQWVLRSRTSQRPFRPGRGSGKPLSLTGGARQAESGHVWRRISWRNVRENLLGQIAVAIREFAHHSDPMGIASPVRMAIPVDLRRHFPGLLSTTNFSGMVHVDVMPEDSADDFRQRLRSMIDVGADVNYSPGIELIRALPFPWLDRMMTDTQENYLRPRFIETAVLSNLGRFSAIDLSCPGFSARHVYDIPIKSNCFILMFCLDGQVDITVGMTHVLAGDGRLDDFTDFLMQRIRAG